MAGEGGPSGEGGGPPPPTIRDFVSLRSRKRRVACFIRHLGGGGRGEGGPPPRAHLQISDVSDQVVPDFSIAQETILVNRNSRKLQGASFRDFTAQNLASKSSQ